MNNQDYTFKLNGGVKKLFREAFLQNIADPGLTLFFLRAILSQNRSAARRFKLEKQGVHVPPFMIFSVTNRCNLDCGGCYVSAQSRPAEKQLGEEKLKDIFRQAEELGISITLVSGGEPLTRPDLFRVTGEFPGMLFALFTNGLLIDGDVINELRKQRHVMPVISSEGPPEETDRRRGPGVSGRLGAVTEALKKAGVMHGISVTVTGNNFSSAVSGTFVEEQLRAGCKLFFFIDYIPVEPGTDELTLSSSQKTEIYLRVKQFRAKYPALFFSFPSGEEDYGGCLAAGRGFIHINAAGEVEPCPFSPCSDSDLNKISLKEALGSEFLRKIRENRGKFAEPKGACALFENREQVSTLLK